MGARLRPHVLLLAACLAAAVPAWPAVAAEAAPGTPGAPPPSVRIRPLFVPVINEGRLEKYNQLEVTLELADPTKLADALAAMPRLHDAMLALVYDAVDEGWIIRGNIANATAFRQRIDQTIEKMLGERVIDRVLITPVARQAPWP